MLRELQDLLILQDRDRKLQKLEAEMRSIPTSVEKEGSKLKADKRSVEVAKQELQACEVEVGKLQLDRRTRQDTVKKLETQMFETKKNDEYEALGLEVKRYQDQVSEIETAELELMEKCDAYKETLTQAEVALQERETLVAENVSELKERARTLVGKYKEAKEERVKSTQGVDKDALALYERVYKSKGDMALAELVEGVCHGCDMKVVASTASKVKADKEIVQCENCARILFET